MKYSEKDHTFIICAYKENQYLEGCIKAVLNQTKLGQVKIATSTPNDYISALANKYGLTVVINKGIGDFEGNMNFALSQAETDLVTMCHQDDYFSEDYLEKTLDEINKCDDMILLYTDYVEDRNGTIVRSNRLMNIKRVMNFPLRFNLFRKQKWVRRLILSLGCSANTATMMYNRQKVSGEIFDRKYHGASDWIGYLELAKLEGAFIYCPRKLLTHRIWEGSGTSSVIGGGSRGKDEAYVFSMLWPKPIAKLLSKIYSGAMKSNRLE